MSKIKLKEWAEKNGLSYITANRYFHAGLIRNAEQLDTGTILVEDTTPEPIMGSNTTNDAMSLFLKKTVEFSKNNSTVEDFAAYVISNFTLKINNDTESPRYSRQKPKPEDVQKHFQQFMPKNEKPKPNSFVLEPETLQDLSTTGTTVNPQELVENFQQAILTPESASEDIGSSNFTTPTITSNCAGGLGVVAESMLTRSVDLNSTPQQINYTGSNNHALSTTLTSAIPIYSSTLTHNSLAGSGIVNSVNSVATNSLSHNLTENNEAWYVSSFQPIKKELESTTETNLPRKRGRKPTKR